MKKIFAVLFILVFLLSLGNLQTQAKTQPTSFAYIPLISPKGGTSLPVEFRARQAFETLMPRLMKAQAKGQVVRFEPEFAFGLLKVEYQSGFDLATALAVIPGAKPLVFDNPQAVLAYTQVSNSMRSSSPQVADATPAVSIGIYNSCYWAGNLDAYDHGIAYLYDTSNRLVASTHSRVQVGTLYNCFGNGNGIWAEMVPGYKFSLNLYNAAGTLLQNYHHTIPRLTIASITISSKTITGTAPANSQLTLHYGHPELNAAEAVTYTEKDVTASSKGAWSAKLASSKATRGGDGVEIDYQADTTFLFWSSLSAPYIYCYLGDNYCEVFGIPGKPAKLSITHGKKTYPFSGYFDNTGYFFTSLYDTNGDPIFLAAGDKASGTGAKAMVIPNLTAVPDYDTDFINGNAPASRYFEVDLNYFDSMWNGWSNWVGSDGTGLYSTDFSGDMDMTSADRLKIDVNYVDPDTGNETFYEIYIDPE